MALQKTITGDAGLEMSYWRITNATFSFEGPPFNIQFNMEGYKDSDYRSSSNAGGNLSFRPALSRTGDIDSYDTLADNILTNTKADIRPALYDWVKTQTGWIGGSADSTQSDTPINWSNATDV